jgi:hypothetical protein
MFRPAWNNPHGFDTLGSGNLSLPPPTMMTEAFVAAHTEVLRQLLQEQQRMAQQLQQMPPLQQKVQPSKPCSPEVPTQRGINAIVGATQLLEGQNSVLNQMVSDIIQGPYGNPYQNSLGDSLSQSLSASMVEQARLFNLLEEYVNQDQPQSSDSILPPSRLPMDLRVEERANRGSKRVLSEIDVSEWEITCANEDVTLTRPLNSLLVQHLREPRSGQGKRRGTGSGLSRKPRNKSPSPETFHPICATIVDNPGISDVIAQNSRIRIRTSEQLSVLLARTQFFKKSQTGLTLWVTPLSQNHFPTSSCSFKSRDKIFLKGGRL